MEKEQIKRDLNNPFISMISILLFVICDNLLGKDIAFCVGFMSNLILFTYRFFFLSGKLNWYLTYVFIFLIVAYFTYDFIDKRFYLIRSELFALAFFSIIQFLKKPILRFLLRGKMQYVIGIRENVTALLQLQRHLIWILGIYSSFFFLLYYVNPNSISENLALHEAVERILILVVGIFVSLQMQWNRKNFKKEIFIPIINKTESLVGYEPLYPLYEKSVLMKENPQKNIHPVSRIFVFYDNKLLLKKNKPDDLYNPNLWDLFFTTHLRYGETYEEGLDRMFGKYGQNDNLKLLLRYQFENKREIQHVFLHTVKVDQSFLKKIDLTSCKFWTLKQLKADLESDIFTPKLKKEIELLDNLSWG